MANNSDIIKIGFDYESGLAEFIKNYNGTMDQVQKSADGNRIEIQFDVSDKDVIKKISAIQGDFKNVKIELNGKELTQQLSSIEAIKDVLISIIKMVNDGTKIDSILNLDKTFSQVDDLKKQISDLKSSMEKMHTDNDIAEAWDEGFRVGSKELEHFRESALASTDVIFKLRKELENLQTENLQLTGSNDYFKGITDRLSQSLEESESKIVELQKRLEVLSKADLKTNISTPKNTSPDAAGASAEDSKVSIEGEADKLKETAQNATEAANAKLKFVDANKKVKDSAKDSADAVQGESDSFKNVNADPYSTYVQNVYKAWQQADKINDALSETQQKFQNIENTFGKSATGGSRFEELFPGVTAQIKTLDDELTQGDRTLKSYTSAIDKLLVKNPEDFLKNSESAIQKTEKNLSNLTVPSNLTSEFSNVKTEVESLNEQLRNNKISISDYKQSVNEKIGDFGNSIKEQKTALEKTLSEMNTLIGKVDYNVKTGKPVEGMRSNEYSTQMNEYKATLEELHTLRETVSKQDFISTAQLQQFDDLKKKVKDSEAQFKLLSAAEKGSDDLSRSKLYSKIGDYLQRNSGMAKEFKIQLKALQKQIEDEGPNANVKDLTNQFIRLQSQIREAGQEGRSFLDVLKDKAFYGFVGQLGTYFGFNDIIRYGQQVAAVVTNLNTKFTDLAKVSEASTQQLYSDFKSYSSIAKDIGGTISDTIDATAAWAKNGYNLPDSKELARVSLLYKNVGDNIDIDTANESLVSTLKGFNLAAEDAEHIIDVFNEVSNNEAISSAGIGTALQRSAASFNAANTSLEKSVALITATNSVLQDEERTGNMWKTVSARIRGADTELKEMGEDTDGLAESTSKLRDLIKGMTGFDIMKDEDTFKDIYDIVVGIGEKWNDLSDINRAALLEKLAGKNQSNALAAALSDIDVLKKSYQEAMDAEGSARREQEKYQESIQYSIDKTKASLEELANDTISSDFVKNLVEGGNTIVNVLDNIITKLGTLPTALGALGAALSINNVGKGKMFPFMNMPTA